MSIKIAVIPAAGLGTRFLPATKAQPKEMLPIVDKPVIHYIVEEAVNSGIEEIIIITGRGKDSIENYFDHSFELHTHLERKGKKELIEQIEKIEKLARFTYIRQPHPLGDGDAILQAYHILKDRPFAVLFGDDIYDSNPPALSQMIEKYEKYQAPIIALTKIDKNDSASYGMVKPKSSQDSLHELSDLVEKPQPSEAPSDLAITGKYIVTPELLEDLKLSTSTHSDQEIRLIDGMKRHIALNPIYGLEIQGERFDTGSKIGYLKAITHFALKNKKLREEFRTHLQNLEF